MAIRKKQADATKELDRLNALGICIADLLGLKECNGRYNTGWGIKTPYGLTCMILEMADDIKGEKA